jgi:hypothetical protein
MRQIVVCSESVLLLALGSAVEELTEAVLMMGPSDIGLTTISIMAESPFPIVPRLHVTMPLNSPHEPLLGVAETKTTLGGSSSVAVTPEAASGPLFLTVSV